MTPVTGLYAGLLALLLIFLSYRVVMYRRGHMISVGDKGDAELLIRIRAHGNCAEYAPMALLLILLVELQGAPAMAVHLLGLSLVAGRLAHAYGLNAQPKRMMFRVVGMVLTFGVLGVAALGLIAHALF